MTAFDQSLLLQAHQVQQSKAFIEQPPERKKNNQNKQVTRHHTVKHSWPRSNPESDSVGTVERSLSISWDSGTKLRQEFETTLVQLNLNLNCLIFSFKRHVSPPTST